MEMAMIPTKRVKPKYETWVPTPDQAGAVEFMVDNVEGMLWADPGAGKTSITLTAFAKMKELGLARTMLVVAPLRVIQLVWEQEGAKWEHLRHLKFVKLHGPHKDKRLEEEADVYLTNYESIDWLCDKYWRRQLPFDVIVADEVTKLKNHASKRAKKLRACSTRTPRKYGLTGTPAPNGYLDLFGQFLWLDEGRALGKFVTHYKDMYFKAGFTGFDYTLQAGAAERIETRIAPAVHRLSYEAIPARDIPIEVEFDKQSLTVYREMKREALIEVEGGVVTAANAAAVYGKLAQLANGAVYLRSGEKDYAEVHSLKLDALEEFIESLCGQQLLIAYEFEHDLERIQKRFPDIAVLRGSEKVVMQMQDDWNAGKIQNMLVHPASVGHGLNLQQSSAHHILWFSPTFNLEHWDQLIRRLRRTGNNAKEVLNHILVVKGTIDELKLAALGDKDASQARLLQGLATYLEDTSERSKGHTRTPRDSSGRAGHGEGGNADLPRQRPDPAGGGPAAHSPLFPADHERGDPVSAESPQGGPDDMSNFKTFSRLPRQDDAQQAAEASAERVTPKGWGKPKGEAPAPAAATPMRQPAANRAQEPVQEDAPPPAPTGRGFFSKGIQEQLEGETVQETAETATVGVPQAAEDKPKAVRAPRAAKVDKLADAVADVPGVAQVDYAGHPGNGVNLNFHGLPQAAVKAALRAIADNL